MKILALDTSGPVAGAALMEDGVITHEVMASHGLTHSQTAMPMVDQCLSSANLTAKDIELFAAVAGPGSFTGVRIGVCAVRALAHAWNKPAVSIDSLETLAMNGFGFNGIICPILDARRGQVYCAAFRFAEGKLPERILEDDAMALTEFLKKLPETKQQAAIDVLSNDPRPSYQRDPDRIYGLNFGGFDIRFKVVENQLTVMEVQSL